jgi:hypothetical protein
LFTAHMGSGSSPFPVEFSSLHHFFKLSHSWLPGTCLPFSPEPLWPGPACLFTVPGRIPLPSSSVHSAPHPLCNLSLLFLLHLTQFLFFSLGGGWSVQRVMLIWPRVVCGSTTYHLAHLVCIFPSCLGLGVWWPGDPPDFSV